MTWHPIHTPEAQRQLAEAAIRAEHDDSEPYILREVKGGGIPANPNIVGIRPHGYGQEHRRKRRAMKPDEYNRPIYRARQV